MEVFLNAGIRSENSEYLLILSKINFKFVSFFLKNF